MTPALKAGNVVHPQLVEDLARQQVEIDHH